jgi:hypothetical protein
MRRAQGSRFENFSGRLPAAASDVVGAKVEIK